MKRFLSTASAFVLLLVPEVSRGATPASGASDAWMNVFVKEVPSSSGTRYEYTIQNKGELAITAIEIGRKNACVGAPSLDSSSLADKALFLAPSGWTSRIEKAENGGSMIRFEGRSTETRLSGFVVEGSNPALSSGFVCIYRADAKVWQYKAAILKDSGMPSITLSLNPVSFQSDTLFHEVNATIIGSDELDSQPQIKLTSIKSSRTDFVFENEVKDAILGTDDRKFQVLADKLGNFIVEYEISDAAGNKALASATVAILAGADKIAPTMTVALSPNSIEANNALVTIAATITVKDNIDKAPTVKLVSITSDAKNFVLANDVKNAVLNSDDRSFQLLAKRSSNVDRVYKITYTAEDAAGNKTTVLQSVTIKAEQKSFLQQLFEAILAFLKRLLAFFFR